jgi:hypothetical protein
LPITAKEYIFTNDTTIRSAVLDSPDGLIVTFSDGTTGAYAGEERLS